LTPGWRDLRTPSESAHRARPLRRYSKLVCYAMEKRGAIWTLAFAGSCLLGSSYGFLPGAWPFGVVEAIWAFVALRRWMVIRAP
jgi:hypothetical protein